MRIKRSHLALLIRRNLVEGSFLVCEGVNDPGIFKAIFLAGCPGSGKGTILRAVFGTDSGVTAGGLKIVNQDSALERYLTAANLMGYQEEFSTEQSSAAAKLASKARKQVPGWEGITPEEHGLDPTQYGMRSGRQKYQKSMLSHYIDGRLGLIIDGTGATLDKTIRQKHILEDLGYETMMISVVVPTDVAVERNRSRGQSGGRGIADIAVIRTCDKLTPNLPEYKREFTKNEEGDMYIQIDNTLPADQTITAEILSKINKFVAASPSTRIAQDWIAAQKQTPDAQPIEDEDDDLEV